MTRPDRYVLRLVIGAHAVTRDLSAPTAQEVHRHARGHLGADRVDVHLDPDTLTGTIRAHGTLAGEFSIQAAVNRRRPTAAPRGPKALPPGPDTPRWPECGTREGYLRHRRERVPKCGPCRRWKRKDDIRRDLLREMMPERLHGTVTGRRDWRCKCERCKAAPGTAPRPTPARPRASLVTREDLPYEPRPRGICPSCGQLRALNVTTGGIRRHGDCPGSGQPPAPEPVTPVSEPENGLRLVSGEDGSEDPCERLLRRLRMVMPNEEAS